MTGAIWLTEEHVINDFKLVWCKDIEVAIISPHKDNVRNGYLVMGLTTYCDSSQLTTAAKFEQQGGKNHGSGNKGFYMQFWHHRCNTQRDILPILAFNILHANLVKVLDQELGILGAQYCIVKMFSEPRVFWMTLVRLEVRGMLLVCKIKQKSLVLSHSAWYPQEVIITNVGTTVTPKKMHNRISFMALIVKIRNICSEINIMGLSRWLRQ